MMARRARIPAVLALLVAALLLASCTLPLPLPITFTPKAEAPLSGAEPDVPAPHGHGRAFKPEAEAPLHGAVLQPPIQLQPFSLQRADGRPFSSLDTRGRTALFFFGYTFCPDVCPLTLVHVAQLRKQLGPQARHLDAYFVTVDPQRDTPQRLLEYTAKFDPAIVALTGGDDQLARVRDLFGVVAQRREVPGSAAGYFMDHSAGLYLADPEGRVRIVYPYGMAPEEIAADLKGMLPR
jgi:protein SCO1